ncbi:MAG: thiamine pyrophosphate-dependent dehydrogenase E1 component subunit alpha, partial [Lentisphaeria bacterium]|nr:thiamine pyrophosphate-dependent dehydrogenase E1 component subunit alpha [Lentisphaeria bacterium]
GGSMHVGDMDKGMVPAIAIVAGGIPLATGIALSYKLRKQANVAVCFFGDGAVNEGAFHEAVNMGAIWDLPVVYVCENNLYGASTAIADTMKLEYVAERAAAYGIPGETVNGNDVLAVYEAMTRVIAETRAGAGPAIVELMTYRRTGHSRRDPCHYQDSPEKEFYFSQDPIEISRKDLEDIHGVGVDTFDEIADALDEEIEAAIIHAQEAPEPEIEDIYDDVLA